MLTPAIICLCALWWGPLVQRAHVASSQADSAETAHQAAQVAMLVLRTTLDGASSAHTFFVLPSREPLSLDQAVRALAMLTKPVRCAGGMEGAVLAVVCQPLAEADAREYHWHTALMVRGFAADIRKSCPGSVREARLLLRRKGLNLTVPFYALATSLRDYYLDFSIGGAGRTPELPPDICLVFEVGPPGTMKIHPETGPVPS